MNLWQQYVRPTSVSEAVTALTSAPGPMLPLAGGTDIMLDLQQGRHSPVHTIVDLTEIPEMKILETRDDQCLHRRRCDYFPHRTGPVWLLPMPRP